MEESSPTSTKARKNRRQSIDDTRPCKYINNNNNNKQNKNE